MTNIVSLTDPGIGALKAIKDGALDVTMRVPLRDLEWADAELRKIMDAQPIPRRTSWNEDGRSEEELSLLAGVFWAAARALPMGTSNFIDWLRRVHGEASFDGFVVWRLSKMDDDNLKQLLLDALGDRNLDTFGLQALESPVRRRRKSA